MSTLKRISPKRSALLRATNKARSDYVKESQMCQVCWSRFAKECHELARGAHRSEAVKHRECWLAVCSPCHHDLDNYAEWPLSRQLAAKLLADPVYFDLKLFNQVRGRAPGAIDMSDIVKHLELKH